MKLNPEELEQTELENFNFGGPVFMGIHTDDFEELRDNIIDDVKLSQTIIVNAGDLYKT